MLVLTRKAGEEIIIDDTIIVKVMAIKDKNSVRIGIDAPGLSIARREVYKSREQRDADGDNEW